MPTYEYECTSCGQHIEVFQRISEDPLTTCGVCGGTLRKVFHPAGIVFKGSGFYATDSRSASRGGTGEKQKADASSSSSSGSGEGGSSTGSAGDSGSSSSSDGKTSSGSGSGSASKKEASSS
jgi:putative FmdB family regulatory protein